MGRGGNDLSLQVVLSAKDQASGTLKGFGSTLINLAGDAGPLLSVFGAISIAAIGIGVKAVQMAAQYQQSMNMVQALTGASQAQMAQYDIGLKNLAMDAGVAPTKLSQGLYYVISAGYQGADALKMLTLATQDAVIGLTDSKITANALTTVMQGFNEKTKDMTIVNGEMLRTVTLGKMSMQDYAGAVSKVAVLHAQFRVTLEDTNATLATLTSSGYKSAAIAATAYGQLVGIMDGKTDLVAKRIHALGLNFDETKFKQMTYSQQLQYLNQVMSGHYDQLQNVLGGSKQAASAFTALMTHSAMFKSNLAALSNQQKNAAATQNAWNITQGGFTQSMNRAGAALSVLLIEIGQQLLPYLTRVVGAIAPAVQWFLSFATAVSHNAVAMAFIKGALVGFVVIVAALLIPALWAWAMAAGAAALATLAATWPVLAIGAAVALVVAGIILAVQRWGQIVAWLKGVWGGIAGFFVGLWARITGAFQAAWAWILGFVNRFKPLFIGLGVILAIALAPLLLALATIIGPFVALIYVVTHFQQVIGALRAFLAAAWSAILNVVLMPIHAIGAAFQWLYQHNTYFKALVDLIRRVFAALFGWLHAGWTAVVSFLSGLWQRLVSIASAVWHAISAVVMAVVSAVVVWLTGIWDTEVRGIQVLWGKLSGFAQGAWNAVVGVFKGVWGTISGVLSGLWTNISGWFSNLAKSALDWGKNVIQGFINGIKSMLGNVGNAVSGVARNVASFLGFHSPAKEGPGATADQWAPNFMKMYIAGIQQGAPALQHAASQGASALMQGFMTPASASSSYSSQNRSNQVIQHVTNNAFTVQVPPGTPRQQALALADELDKIFAQKWRARSNIQVATSGSVRS